MSPQRITAMDASFLYSDDGRSHNDVGMVMVLEGPPPSREELLTELQGRLPRLPHFRSRLREVPFQAALPVWVDDVAFDLGGHVISHGDVTDVLGPDEDPDAVDLLSLAVSDCMSAPMDLSRPLWEVHCYENLGQVADSEDAWCLVLRMHHGMVDGVSSTAIVSLLCSTSPEGDPPEPDDWTPQPEPSDAELLAATARDAARDTAALWGRLLTPTPPPSLPEVDLTPLLRVGAPLPDGSMNGPLGPDRSWAMTQAPLRRLKKIRTGLQRHGVHATINDVLLIACAGGFSRFLSGQGVHVEGRVMRTMVPVSMRQTGSGPGGNDIGAMLVELPLGSLPLPLVAARVTEQTEAFKQLKDAVAGEVSMSEGSSLLSPLSLMAGVRAASSAPSPVNTVITNVPGPADTLYFCASRLERLGACIALWAPLNVALSVISYDGIATLGVVAGAERYPDLAPLLDALDDALDALEAFAASPSGT